MYRNYKLTEDMASKNALKKQIKTIVFLGSVREGRHSLKVAKFVKKELEKANHSVEIFDPLELKFPLLVKPIHWYADQSQVPEWLVAANKKIQEADAFVLISGEYNRCIPPALSNMLDHFPPASFAYKPTGIVVYSMGPFAGMNAAQQLRSLMSELGAITIGQLFGIPTVHEAFDAEGAPKNEHLVPGAQKLVVQLDWYAHALKTQRESQGIPK